jgi:drug/metabolite transporter (DMT)-like permease
MKEGMVALTPYQVATIRMLSAGLVLLPVALKQLSKIPSNKLVYIILSGLLGNFFPAYLFCVAETRIDSSLAGILNALTPIFTIVIGVLFFQSTLKLNKILGVIIAFSGMLILFFAKGMSGMQDIGYAALLIIATICYGLNINMVSRHLKATGSTNIVAIAFLFLIIPCIVILYFTGYFHLPLMNTKVLVATGASCVLGIMGTSIASILFYVLMKRSGALFASMVTYGIPFIALFWGILAGESINAWQIAGLAVILAGVFMTSK